MAQVTTETRRVDAESLDAYSTIVTTVARDLTQSVASIEVRHRRPNGTIAGGAGSAVVFTDDGCLLTNAHVVGKRGGGQADLLRRQGCELSRGGH